MQSKPSADKPIITDTGLSETTLRTLLRVGCIGVPAVITALVPYSETPLWAYAIIWGAPLFMYHIMASSMMPSNEERVAHELEHAPNAAQGEAVVTAVKHDGIMETERLRMTRLRLRVALPPEAGEGRQADLVVKVEDALLPNFASGKKVHVLYDPADPRRVAVDRARSPLRIQ